MRHGTNTKQHKLRYVEGQKRQTQPPETFHKSNYQILQRLHRGAKLEWTASTTNLKHLEWYILIPAIVFRVVYINIVFPISQHIKNVMNMNSKYQIRTSRVQFRLCESDYWRLEVYWPEDGKIPTRVYSSIYRNKTGINKVQIIFETHYTRKQFYRIIKDNHNNFIVF